MEVGGLDSDGREFKNAKEMWREELGEGNHHKKSEWYQKGVGYWEGVEASVDGVLGGYGHVNDADVKSSEAFFKTLLSDRLTSDVASTRHLVTLDYGSGIGRVTKNLLLNFFNEVVALANLMLLNDSVDELDSYMYQTVGHQIVVSYARCTGLPLFHRHQNLSYRMSQGDEVEDMLILLAEVKRQIPSITAVSSGAIASDYQRLRVESICTRLGLVSLAYLWKQDQSLLLQEMITNGIIAITVKVAAMGLDPAKHLGKELAYLQPHLHRFKELYGINVCGEEGEYETLTLDCPLFKGPEFATIVNSVTSKKVAA